MNPEIDISNVILKTERLLIRHGGNPTLMTFIPTLQ